MIRPGHIRGKKSTGCMWVRTGGHCRFPIDTKLLIKRKYRRFGGYKKS